MKEKSVLQEVFEIKDKHSDEWFLGWLEINKNTLLEKEKQQIIQAWADGDDNGYGCYAEKYYLQKYE